jgi:hypothetical protein
MKHMSKMAIAIGLGLTLLSAAASPSMARSLHGSGDHYYEPSNNGSVWSYYPGYEDSARSARASVPHRYSDRAYSARAQSQSNGGGTHYYEGDDNGSVWSYYQGYKPLDR